MTNEILDKITSRPFQTEDDFWQIRSLLTKTYPITPVGFNWEIRRWDGWRYHREDDALNPAWSSQIHLWENKAGKLVGVAHPEGDGFLCLELHPDYRCLEDEMFAWGEDHLATCVEQERCLDTFVFDYDRSRCELLEKRGYERMPYGGYTRCLRLDCQPLHYEPMPEGYRLRSTHTTEDDCQHMADLLNAAFGRTIHTAKEYHTFVADSPSFHHLLNLVAVAPDGTFAAHVGLTYDAANQRAIVEPVCTHPDHRRQGLARTLLIAGMRRAKILGAIAVFLDTGDDLAANQFYEAVGFTEAYRGYIWRKQF